MGLKALLVGVNAYPASPLKGCLNDAIGLRDLLSQQHHAGEETTRLLLDEAATRAAIVDGLRWLAQTAPGERDPIRLFHFSGHGSFVADRSGDEPDGTDECVLPYDYAAAGPLSDDTLREFYARFGAGTHLLLIMDCCHSGTIERMVAEDIRFRFIAASDEERQRVKAAAQRFRERREAFVLEQMRALRGEETEQDELARRVRELVAQFDKQHFGRVELDGNIVLLAACRADQTAADALFGERYHGALTYYLLDVLRETRARLTYAALIGRLGRALDQSSFLQEPQLECSSANSEALFLRGAI